jgi:hypothetical protein
LQAPARGQIVRTPDASLLLLYEGTFLDQWASSFSLEESIKDVHNNVLVVFGLGVGHAIRRLRELTRGPIVVYEPEPGIVRRVLEFGPCDFSDIPIFTNTHDLIQAWPIFSRGCKAATLLRTPGYTRAFPEEEQTIVETVGQLVQRHLINDATHRYRSRQWIQNVLANLPLLTEHPSFMSLAGKYRGVPAFIVGAGPSLGKNGRCVAEAAKRGIVFAVNSSARALASYGVEPQVLGCMESLDVSHLLSGVPFIGRCARAFSLTTNPRNMRVGGGPLLHLYEGLAQISAPLAELTGQRGLGVCASVSTLLFALAQRLGCSPIVLVGQDLAYTDGLAYAPGSPYEHSRVRRAADGNSIQLDWCETLKTTHNVGPLRMHTQEPLLEIPAWGGQGSVTTGLLFSPVRAWLESSALEMEREYPDQHLINSTEGGASVSGFQELTLADVTQALPLLAISPESLKADASRETPPLAASVLIEWFERQLNRTLAVKRAERRARRYAQASERALARSATPTIARNFARLEAAEQELRDTLRNAPFVEAFSYSDVEEAMDDYHAANASEDSRERAQAALTAEHQIFSGLKIATQGLETELRTMLAKLTSPEVPS